MSRCRLPQASRQQQGFSLLELSLCLVVVGLLGVLVSNAYGTAANDQAHQQARAAGAQLQQAVLTFSLRQRRLPCPDSSGDGREGDANGNCPAGLVLGRVPYLSLGLSLPVPAQRGLLGVYRSAAVDLAQNVERSGDAPTSPRYHSLGDLMLGLVLAAAQPVTQAAPFLTGNDAEAGAQDCAGRHLSNPAFVLVLPASDRNASGQGFEGPHADLLAGQTCVISPGRASDLGYDDVVLAQSLHSLMGWLAPYNH
ncbi:prepilin-type N-terminal cleavage/methylation domain-containing protein [Pseudomonas sp. GWSMS-1]|jgi:prepilin-type N-terminal cleavage/methylation domain-containing protein|uniref:prepilin-type N-terminal cleavage/methylation domain-containing protein n=1 Tax=Pseudomonas sp. GWSMS-1 TaxID=3308997 RepID=UPI003CE89737